MASSTRLYQLEHCTYRCEYHIVWIPKYRGKVMSNTYIKQEFKRIFKQIAKWKGFKLFAWHIGDDHIHLYLSIPPKYSISYAICILKSKSSSWIKRKNKKIPKGSYWARGYFVSTIGIDEQTITNYIHNQQHHRVDAPKLNL